MATIPLVAGFERTGPSSTGDYLDKWAVKVKGGKEVADAVAAEHGFRNIGQVRCAPFQHVVVVVFKYQQKMQVAIDVFPSSFSLRTQRHL